MISFHVTVSYSTYVTANVPRYLIYLFVSLATFTQTSMWSKFYLERISYFNVIKDTKLVCAVAIQAGWIPSEIKENIYRTECWHWFKSEIILFFIGTFDCRRNNSKYVKLMCTLIPNQSCLDIEAAHDLSIS